MVSALRNPGFDFASLLGLRGRSESHATRDVQGISHRGGWRAFLAARTN